MVDFDRILNFFLEKYRLKQASPYMHTFSPKMSDPHVKVRCWNNICVYDELMLYQMEFLIWIDLYPSTASTYMNNRSRTTR